MVDRSVAERRLRHLGRVSERGARVARVAHMALLRQRALAQSARAGQSEELASDRDERGRALRPQPDIRLDFLLQRLCRHPHAERLRRRRGVRSRTANLSEKVRLLERAHRRLVE